MARRRAERWAVRIAIAVVLLPIVVWLGVSAWATLTVAKGSPFWGVAEMVGAAMFGGVRCSVMGCEPEGIDGLEITTFTEDLVEDTIVALDIDEAGRVYVAETGRHHAGVEDNREHPERWLLWDLAARTVEDRAAYYARALEEGMIEAPDHFTRNHDRLVRVEDLDGDGVADVRRVLARWNESVSGLIAGVEVREGSVWTTKIPGIYRLEDDGGDEPPVQVEELARGFGVHTSLNGHDLHGLAWGPDGKLYFSLGDRSYHVTRPDGRVLAPEWGAGRGAVFRMHPDGSELEVFATGLRNPQELAFDDFGNLFTGDNNGDGGDAARVVYVVEGGETGWAMPVQSLAGDYVRGPWVAERLWDLQHPTQPAWVLPPVGHLGNGPSGLVHYPGLGLPERYADHFFLCDYGYTPARSGIWSFRVTPRGAGFELEAPERFLWSVLATDIDFGWDGRMMASLFDQFGNGRSLARIEHGPSRRDPRVVQLTEQVATGIAEKSDEALLALLDFDDQRLRLRAQFELARRGVVDPLVRVARDEAAPLRMRVHAIWGLGQQGAVALAAWAEAGPLLGPDDPDELRAQWLRVVGDARAQRFEAGAIAALRDPAPRVRFFAAQALGALAARSAVPALFELLEDNGDEDVFLRHAAVHALDRIGDRDAVAERLTEANRSVRLGALLALRRGMDPRVAAGLADPDPLLQVEAARAIYDLPLEAAMPALAAMLPDLEPADEADRQVARALHRRAIGANVRLRSRDGARALARYAADERQLEALRRLALEALGTYSAPPPRDLTFGFFRPLDPVPHALVAEVFEADGRALLGSSLGSRALEIADRLGVVPLSRAELLARLRSGDLAPGLHAATLRTLARRGAGEDGAGEAVREAVRGALGSDSEVVRMAAREALASIEPEGRSALWLAARSAGTLRERQQAWRQLAEIAGDSNVEAALRDALAEYRAGRLEAGVALEVLQAASRHLGASTVEAELAPGVRDSVAAARWALAGGDAEAGRRVFQGAGDCARCHGERAGHGAGVGPSLAGVAEQGAGRVLESLLDPAARIVPGFAQVSFAMRDGRQVTGLLLEEDESGLRVVLPGGREERFARAEIAQRDPPTSGMPPLGRVLEPGALRDVVAYVMSLPGAPPRAADASGGR